MMELVVVCRVRYEVGKIKVRSLSPLALLAAPSTMDHSIFHVRG